MQVFDSMPTLEAGQCHSNSNTKDMSEGCNDSNEDCSDQPESGNAV